MAYVKGDDLFLLKNVSGFTAEIHGKPMRVVAENAGYCKWMEAQPRVFGPNRHLQAYLWAHPPAWRGRLSALPQGTKPPVLIVLDTETTSCFDDKRDGTGLPRGGPRELVADDALARRVHLLDVAWKVVDPSDMSVLESYQTLCRPEGTFEYVYDQALYQEALNHGRPLSECMEALMDTLQRMRSSYEPYIVCHNVAFDRKVIAYSLAVAGMDQAYFEILATPWLCTMASAFAMEAGEYDTWARRTYPEAYATNPSPKPPKLERLHVFCTGKDVVQSHRAMADVEMLCACLPDLMRRGWFKLPFPTGSPTLPSLPSLPPSMVVAIKVQLKKVKFSGHPRPKPSAASKHTSASTPTRRNYFLRSRGPAPVLCL